MGVNNLHGYLIFNDLLEVTQGDHREEHFQVRGASFADNEHYPWPDNLSDGFSTIAKKFMEKCQSLSLTLLEAIVLGLGLDETHFTKVHSSLQSDDTLTTLGGMYCTCIAVQSMKMFNKISPKFYNLLLYHRFFLLSC